MTELLDKPQRSPTERSRSDAFPEVERPELGLPGRAEAVRADGFPDPGDAWVTIDHGGAGFFRGVKYALPACLGFWIVLAAILALVLS